MIENIKKKRKKVFKTIAKNLKRRTPIVDERLIFHKKMPVPSWIELSIIDVCNRSCVFCPKSNPLVAPDTYQQMENSLIEKLGQDLKKMGFKGSFTLCGYGEPMLHKNVNQIVKTLAKVSFVEVVTNGDTLTPKKIRDLYDSNLNKLLISLYDGPEQVEKFKEMQKTANVPDDFVILRDRWYSASEEYGLKLTNRTGTIDVGPQEKIGEHKTCFYPSYQALIDWNGDVFLCPQDWQRRVTMGNIMQKTFFEIWSGKVFNKFRKDLLCSKRDKEPCKSCNADGTFLGKIHADAWKKHYSF